MSYPYYHPYFNPHAGASINQSPLIDFPIIKHLEGHTPRTEAEITTYGERLSSLRLRRALLVFPVLAIICVECRATYLLIQPTSIYGWAATLPIAGLLAYNLSNLVWWTYLRTAGGDFQFIWIGWLEMLTAFKKSAHLFYLGCVFPFLMLKPANLIRILKINPGVILGTIAVVITLVSLGRANWVGNIVLSYVALLGAGMVHFALALLWKAFFGHKDDIYTDNQEKSNVVVLRGPEMNFAHVTGSAPTTATQEWLPVPSPVTVWDVMELRPDGSWKIGEFVAASDSAIEGSFGTIHICKKAGSAEIAITKDSETMNLRYTNSHWLRKHNPSFL